MFCFFTLPVFSSHPFLLLCSEVSPVIFTEKLAHTPFTYWAKSYCITLCWQKLHLGIKIINLIWFKDSYPSVSSSVVPFFFCPEGKTSRSEKHCRIPSSELGLPGMFWLLKTHFSTPRLPKTFPRQKETLGSLGPRNRWIRIFKLI